MRARPREASRALLLALTLLVGTAACGEAPSDPTDPGDATASVTEAPTEQPFGEVDEPTAAYLAWLAALAERDAAEACRLQHPELTIALRYEAILLDRAELGDPCVGFEALVWEDPLRELEPVSVETTRLTEEKATLAVVFPGGEETVELELQRAAWRVLEVTGRADGTGADTDRWLAAWCDLSLGSDRDAVLELMGEASGEYTVANGGEPQLWWAQDQYDFRAYLDPVDGTVTDLVGDYDALAAADRALLDCPELR